MYSHLPVPAARIVQIATNWAFEEALAAFACKLTIMLARWFIATYLNCFLIFFFEQTQKHINQGKLITAYRFLAAKIKTFFWMIFTLYHFSLFESIPRELIFVTILRLFPLSYRGWQIATKNRGNKLEIILTIHLSEISKSKHYQKNVCQSRVMILSR